MDYLNQFLPNPMQQAMPGLLGPQAAPNFAALAAQHAMGGGGGPMVAPAGAPQVLGQGNQAAMGNATGSLMQMMMMQARQKQMQQANPQQAGQGYINNVDSENSGLSRAMNDFGQWTGMWGSKPVASNWRSDPSGGNYRGMGGTMNGQQIPLFDMTGGPVAPMNYGGLLGGASGMGGENFGSMLMGGSIPL